MHWSDGSQELCLDTKIRLQSLKGHIINAIPKQTCTELTRHVLFSRDLW